VANGRKWPWPGRSCGRPRYSSWTSPPRRPTPGAEYELFARLLSLAEGRTAVFISPRFSTVRKADRIILFHQGRLAGQGTHSEPMRLAGRYAELFTLQASAYLD